MRLSDRFERRRRNTSALFHLVFDRAHSWLEANEMLAEAHSFTVSRWDRAGRRVSGGVGWMDPG